MENFIRAHTKASVSYINSTPQHIRPWNAILEHLMGLLFPATHFGENEYGIVSYF